MAFGQGENPAVSVTSHLEEVEYPVTKELLVQTVMDADAPAAVINVFKALPGTEYANREGILRDLTEAARRFALGQ